MSNTEIFEHFQPLAGSDPAYTGITESGITEATPAFTPLAMTDGKAAVWDGEGNCFGMLALALAGTESRLTYFKTGTFRNADVNWPADIEESVKFTAFAGTAISIVD